MKDKELSQWFYINVQKPWEPGVYLVKSKYSNFVAGCYWHGDRWGNAAALDDKNEALQAAARWKDDPIGNWESEIHQWLGLNHNPDAPVKQKSKGNKRKTMYVVCHQASRSTEAAFNQKENAQEYAEYLNFPVYIKKIRFRTPEA